MAAWRDTTQKISDRIKNGITKLLIVRQLRLRQRLVRKSASESKSKKKISPQEAVALIASIVIIIIAFGGMGLVYNVFP
jgi:hypothetical protein